MTHSKQKESHKESRLEEAARKEAERFCAYYSELKIEHGWPKQIADLLAGFAAEFAEKERAKVVRELANRLPPLYKAEILSHLQKKTR